MVAVGAVPGAAALSTRKALINRLFWESDMKKLVAAICFMLAASPLALAQDKAKDAEKKAAPAAEKSAKKDAPKKEPSAKQKAQQEKMKNCAKQADDKTMKGDDRKKFMSQCLSGKGAEKAAKAKDAEKKSAMGAEKSAKAKKEPSEKQKAQQARMKDCSEKAGEKKLKGDERKKFMSGCLKG